MCGVEMEGEKSENRRGSDLNICEKKKKGERFRGEEGRSWGREEKRNRSIIRKQVEKKRRKGDKKRGKRYEIA